METPLKLRYANVEKNTLESLAVDLRRVVGTEPDIYQTHLRALEPPSWVYILLDAPWWLQALSGVAAPYLVGFAKRAGERTFDFLSTHIKKTNQLKRVADSIRSFRERDGNKSRISIGFDIPEVWATSLTVGEDIELSVVLFVYHLPQLIEVMEREKLADIASTGVHLELLADGGMVAKWFSWEDGRYVENTHRFDPPVE